MQAKELQLLSRAQPFRPFVIRLADGRGVPVDHPEFMALAPTGRSAVVYGKGGAFEVIDVPLVIGLEVPNGNSRIRRKKKR